MHCMSRGHPLSGVFKKKKKKKMVNSIVTTNEGTGIDAIYSLNNMRAVFGPLQSIWSYSSYICRIFNVCVVSILLYGNETW